MKNEQQSAAPDLFERIRRAAKRGKGLRLTADEVALLEQDYAICMAPQDVAEDQKQRERLK